ncbi:hypothetical protein CLOP_g216 [Closterium sp. NIES-67]|nr:hypothetical protein CLOP_g216 [Closterium sp. NIES-67]
MFEHIKDLVEADDSGPRTWKLLRDVIQPNTLPMVIVLEKELAAISMRPGDDVKPVLDKIKDTYARMAAAGSSVPQLQQCTKIISVLDNSWDNLIPTLNSQQDQWTPEWLKQQILQEDFRRRHKSKAEVTFGPTSCRAKLGKKVLWSLEEETSCIKDLWELPIIPWNGKTPTTATAAVAKATAGGDATAPTDGDLEAVKKQKKGKDYDEVFAPVGKGTTLKVLLAIAALLGWKIWQMDIVTAFLNGIILEEVYMKQPEGLDDGSGRA